ncbi:TPA: hypothetical protein EYP75_06270 [Candidatus Bathyarchaeota archaeon]|nr:hypothetical protein [Candidatus Bathyarchaeota archaeon]
MRRLRKDSSGQVLLLAALAMAFIISSVMVYVYQTSQDISWGERSSRLNSFIRNVKLASRNLVIGSLANISWGGSNETLENNLQRWESFVESHYYLGESAFSFELCEDYSYSSGLRIFWGTSGFGVSSAKVDYSLNLTDENGEVTARYSVNVTTHIMINATSQWIRGFHYINVTIQVFNEDSPALCGNLAVYYKDNDGNWHYAGLLDSYVLEDYGNGTYFAKFIVGPPRVFNREIRVECFDQREIYVEATTTCEDV